MLHCIVISILCYNIQQSSIQIQNYPLKLHLHLSQFLKLKSIPVKLDVIVKPDESMMIHLCNVVLVLLGRLIILGLFCLFCFVFARIMASIKNFFPWTFLQVKCGKSFKDIHQLLFSLAYLLMYLFNLTKKTYASFQ